VTRPKILRFRRENHPVSRPIGSMSEAASTDRLLRPDEVADRLGVPPGTLANWRYQGHGPTYLKVGRHVRYRAIDVDTWLDRQAVTSHR
jgi:excisionase family DNA binding protein